jgi:hypothetical protein
MKKILVIAFTICSVFAVSNVFASNAGVGLGAVVFQGKQGKVFEVLAITTNGTSYTSTFAITSGTSGYKDGLVIGVNVVDAYVADNMDNLATDIAKGDGEYLDALASLMKVENKDSFKSKLQKNFNKIYTTKDVTSKEVVANIKEIQNS